MLYKYQVFIFYCQPKFKMTYLLNMLRPFMIRIFFISFIFCFLSCSQEKKGQIKVDLSKAKGISVDDIHIKNDIEIDSIIDPASLTFIPLETKKNILIGAISKIIPVDTSFIIIDKGQNKILAYDKRGKLINTIGQLGKGPTEYQNIINVCYNPYTKLLDVSDITLRMLSYNLKTGLIINKNKKLIKTSNAFLFHPLAVNEYVLYNNFAPTKEDKTFGNRFLHYKKQKLLHSELPFEANKPMHAMVSLRQFYLANDSLRFYETFKPLVYSVTRNGLNPLFYFNFKSTPNLDINNDNELISNKALPKLAGITETVNYSFFNFIKDGYRVYVLLKKQSTFFAKCSYQGYLIKSIGLELPLEFYNADNNTIITYLSAARFINFRKSFNLKTKFNTTVKEKINSIKLENNSNPILISFKIRE